MKLLSRYARLRATSKHYRPCSRTGHSRDCRFKTDELPRDRLNSLTHKSETQSRSVRAFDLHLLHGHQLAGANRSSFEDLSELNC